MEKFIKAIFDAENRTMTAWTERNCMEFWTYTQEEYDDYVTFENLVEYLQGATELPEGYESYEDWANDIWSVGEQHEIMMDTSYCCYWREICELAGIDEDEIPYSSCCAIGPANWKAA